MAMVLVAVGLNAQTWTAPELPTADTPASDPVSGRLYQVRNVEAGMFLAGGASWYSWATSTVLVDPALVDALIFTLTETEKGWTFARTTDGKFTFISGTYNGKGEMHVDMASQGHNYFEIIKQDNGKYHIRAVADDANYGSTMEGYEEKCWGWEGYDSDFPTAVYATVVPDESVFCDWEFVDMSVYQARLDLYNLTAAADEEDLGVDYSPYEDVFYNGDYEQLQAAVAELKNLVTQARIYRALRYGEDGINPPSQDNPADATSLIANNDFSAGNISGWTCTFVSGQNATNVGYQGAGYSNGDVQISQFIEAWAANGTKFNPELSFSAIGDGELSQTMPGLPAGLYRFTVDCIAVQQWSSTENPVKGVQLFAKGGDLDRYTEIYTGDGVPEHFEMTFVSTGGDVTLGLRTVNATANWIAADNFTLTYYGEVQDDPQKVLLDQRISELEAQYPYPEDEMANNDVRDAYIAALDAAKGAVEDYEAVLAALNEAADAFTASVNEYNALAVKIENLQTTIDQLTEQWPDIAGDLEDWFDGVMQGYESCTYTSEDIANIDPAMQAIISKYISENAKAGDDLTILLTNPSFDTQTAEGWTVVGTVTDAKGTATYNGVNDGAMADEDTTGWGSDCETFHATFDLSQALKTPLPAGMYKFTCQGFYRADDDNTPAQLYAIVNGKEQTANLSNIVDYATEEQLYSVNGTDSWPSDNHYNGDNEKWYPNSMSGALYHFHHTHINAAGEDEYDYTSTLNIILTEPTEITVGVRNTSTGTWVIFDNFTITYMGKVYKQYIDELIEKAEAEETERLTTEARTALDEAITAGDAAGNGGTDEECVAAIEQLRAALEFAEETKALLDELEQFCLELNDRSAGISSSDGDFMALLEGTADNLASMDYEYATNAEVEQLFIDLKKAFTHYVQVDFLSATEEEPGDISAAIYNGTFTDINEVATNVGWTINGNLGLGAGAAEFFNQGFELSQVIYGLAPGYYRLYVNGFYRNGGYADVETTLNEGGQEANNVTLFAGDETTYLLPISTDMAACTENGIGGVNITVGEETFNLPNSMDEAASAFETTKEDGSTLYQNCLQFEVAEGQESVTIGLKKEVLVTSDWTMFDTWRLEYLGTTTPTENPSTEVQGVEAELPAQAVIYNIAGQRVSKATKGIFIINGKKVVVK